MIATIKIEISVGVTIEDAFAEAVRLSNQLNVGTEFDFNGISCIAQPGRDAEKGVQSYHRALKSKFPVKLAST